jgi:hypothetical protein
MRPVGWLCLAVFVMLGGRLFAQSNDPLFRTFVPNLSAADQSDIQATNSVRDRADNPDRDLEPHGSFFPSVAPRSLFGNSASRAFDLLPSGPQPVFYGNSAKAQKAANENMNWTLMTPAQILGVATPAETLGVPDPNEDPNLTPEERFLQRQDQQNQHQRSRPGFTNSIPSFENRNIWRSSDFSGSAFGPLDANNRLTDSDKSGRDSLRPADQRRVDSMGLRSGPFSDVGDRANSSWASSFPVVDQPSKPTPAQLEGMDRFRDLMDSTSLPKPVAALGAFQPVGAAPVAATPDPFLQPLPAFNPAGSTFAPLHNDIARPVGLTPLSGISGPPPSRKPPPPLVKPPPWASPNAQYSGPAPMNIDGFSPAQRQF